MIISVDLNRKITDFDSGAEETFGYKKEEVLGLDIGTLYAYKTEIDNAGEQLLRYGFFNCEVLNRRKSGEVFTSFLSATQIRSAEGKVIGTIGISRELSDQSRPNLIKESHDRLLTVLESVDALVWVAESHERLLTVLESVDALVWVADYDTNEIIYANKAMLGSLGNVLGQSCKELLHPGMSAPRKSYRETCGHNSTGSAPEEVFVWDYYIQAIGRHYQSRARVIRWVDGRRAMLEIATDITERKRMEEGLQKAKEQAEKANSLKDKFVSLVAHDLKSPFNSILGFLRIMKDDRKNPLHETHKRMVSRSIETGQRLVGMIEELLKISRLQTGNMVPKPRFFDAHLSAEYAVGSFAGLASNKGVKLINEVPRGTRLYADVNLFGEVIQNLVSNALKFTGEGGKVTVFVPDGGISSIAVADTGTGISGKLLENIFRREVTTTTLGTDGEVGTGLGMPLCNDIMEAHGGKLRVESAIGEGSVFYAELPHMFPKILIVDDDEATRFMFKGYMDHCGCDIFEASNGEEALRILCDRQPSLILTDVEMPLMNGWEFLRRVKASDKTKSIPIIVITSSTSIEDREKAFQLGSDDYLTKPFVLEDLLPRVKRFIG